MRDVAAQLVTPTAEEPAAVRAAPFLVNAGEAARLCGIGLTTWYSLIAQGRVPPPMCFGRRRLWRVDELRAWVAAGCPRAEAWASWRAAVARPGGCGAGCGGAGATAP